MSAVAKLNEQELTRGVPDSSSWHNDYKDTAWVKVVGLAPELTEGDIICVFSQFGEIEDIELIRDSDTGRSKGLCFIKFEQFKSAVLTVDNFNEVELLGRTLRVDHHRQVFRRTKKHEGLTLQELLKEIRPGRSYENKEIEGTHTIQEGVDVYDSRNSQPVHSWKAEAAASTSSTIGKVGQFSLLPEETEDERKRRKQEKKERKERKKEKKEKKEKKKHKRADSSASES